MQKYYMSIQQCRNIVQQGFTLVELVIAISIVGIIMTGVVVTSAELISNSADPMMSSQRVHIGEAYLEEIISQRFKLPGAGCRPAPDRTDGVSATSNTCLTNSRSFGTISAKDRQKLTQICQYPSLGTHQVESQFGEISAGVCGYSAAVTVVGTNNLGPTTPASKKISAIDAALITVTITSPDNKTTVLSSYAADI